MTFQCRSIGRLAQCLLSLFLILAFYRSFFTATSLMHYWKMFLHCYRTQRGHFKLCHHMWSPDVYTYYIPCCGLVGKTARKDRTHRTQSWGLWLWGPLRYPTSISCCWRIIERLSHFCLKFCNIQSHNLGTAHSIFAVTLIQPTLLILQTEKKQSHRPHSQKADVFSNLWLSLQIVFFTTGCKLAVCGVNLTGRWILFGTSFTNQDFLG